MSISKLYQMQSPLEPANYYISRLVTFYLTKTESRTTKSQTNVLKSSTTSCIKPVFYEKKKNSIARSVI